MSYPGESGKTFQTRSPVNTIGNAPANTVNVRGWNGSRARLIRAELMGTTLCTVGTYTFALTKDPDNTAVNMLAAATFDAAATGTMVADTPKAVPLSATDSALLLDASTTWAASFASSDAGLDAAGMYFVLTWQKA